MSPLLNLLPVRGKLSSLEPLTASFYARFERVAGLLKELDNDPNAEARKRLSAEENMLKAILHWLEVKPEGVA